MLSISLLLLCRPCLCVLFCCLRGPDLWRTLSSNAILIYTTRAIRKPLTNTKSSLRTRSQYPVLMLGMLWSCSMMAQTNKLTFKRNGSKCYTSNWLLSLTTLPFIAYKKDLLPATNSLSFADNPRSTNYESSWRRKPSEISETGQQSWSRLHGYYFYLNNNSKGVIHG